MDETTRPEYSNSVKSLRIPSAQSCHLATTTLVPEQAVHSYRPSPYIKNLKSSSENSLEDVSPVLETPVSTSDSNAGSTLSSLVLCRVCSNHNFECHCQSQMGNDGVPGYIYEGGFLPSKAELAAQSPRLQTKRRDWLAGHATIGNRSIDILPPSVQEARASDVEISTGRFCAQNSTTPSATIIKGQVTLDRPQYHSEVEESDEDEDDELRDGIDEESGHEDGLESVVINAVGEDLELAAYLIPLLHEEYHLDLEESSRQIVGQRCKQLTECSPGVSDTGTAEAPSSTTQSNTGQGNPKKRQRRQTYASLNREAGNEDDDEEGDDAENHESKEFGEPGNGKLPKSRPLACPFHKRQPTKYCIQYGNIENPRKFRSCEGPGFTNIQRLKEHIKRVHYPVQCDRCYEIFLFSGTDRAIGVHLLQRHRQLTTSCKLRDLRLKEGISDAQCADLDKKKRTNKAGPTTSSVEKYWDIWDILFPTIERPSSPWYDGIPSDRNPGPFYEQSSEFSDLFNVMLLHKVNQQHIRFQPGFNEVMHERVSSLVNQAFSIYIGLHGNPSTSITDPSRDLPQGSLRSGSFEKVPTRPSQVDWPSSSPSGSSVPISQPFPLEFQSSPPGDQTMMETRQQISMEPYCLNLPEQQPHDLNYAQHSSDINDLHLADIPGFVGGRNTDMMFPEDCFNNATYASVQDLSNDFLPGIELGTTGIATSFGNGGAADMSQLIYRPRHPFHDHP